METEETICRLCLKICDRFKALEENMKMFLNKLMLKINLAAVQKSVVCTKCAEILVKCFDFKAMCLNVHDNIVPFVNDKDVIKPDRIHMPLSGNEKGNGVPEDQGICAFCRCPIRRSTIIPHVKKGDVLLMKMIKRCLPELDLSISKKIVICASCHGSLEIFFHFLTNCLMVEEKIKKYCETLDINSTDQIELSNLIQSPIRNVTTLEVNGNLVDIVKIEELCKEIENADEIEVGIRRDMIKLERVSYDDSEDAEVEIEHETKSHMEMTDVKFYNEEQFTQKNTLACKEESDSLDGIKTEEAICKGNEIKEENLVEMEDQKFLLNEEIEIKTDEFDFDRFDGGVVLPYVKVATEAKTYKCDSCSYQTKYERYLKKHLVVHAPHVKMYKCDSCPFQTKRKSFLRRHFLLLHKDPSEVTMYKCDACSFQTKYEANLKNHLIVHKDPSEVKMYQCDSCSFQTKYEASLKKHVLWHKGPSETTMYKCDSCSYHTKYETNLKRHVLGHKDPSEVIMYKCDSCSFQSKHKGTLKVHSLVHASQATMYKCDACSFQTKHRSCLRKHCSRLHKDPSEVTMYTCDSCSYQTKYKDNLRRHFLMHRDPSEITMYNCEFCSFQSKRKESLKEHLLVHAPQAKVYKCDSCLFQTKHKCCLRKHFLRLHKDPSEVTMYKCDSCSFQTKYEDSLKYHLLGHKDPSKVTLYKCDSCSYQTKRKRDVKRHFLLLHTPPEITKP